MKLETKIRPYSSSNSAETGRRGGLGKQREKSSLGVVTGGCCAQPCGAHTRAVNATRGAKQAAACRRRSSTSNISIQTTLSSSTPSIQSNRNVRFTQRQLYRVGSNSDRHRLPQHHHRDRRHHRIMRRSYRSTSGHRRWFAPLLTFRKI